MNHEDLFEDTPVASQEDMFNETSVSSQEDLFDEVDSPKATKSKRASTIDELEQSSSVKPFLYTFTDESGIKYRAAFPRKLSDAEIEEYTKIYNIKNPTVETSIDTNSDVMAQFLASQGADDTVIEMAYSSPRRAQQIVSQYGGKDVSLGQEAVAAVGDMFSGTGRLFSAGIGEVGDWATNTDSESFMNRLGRTEAREDQGFIASAAENIARDPTLPLSAFGAPLMFKAAKYSPGVLNLGATETLVKGVKPVLGGMGIGALETGSRDLFNDYAMDENDVTGADYALGTATGGLIPMAQRTSAPLMSAFKEMGETAIPAAKQTGRDIAGALFPEKAPSLPYANLGLEPRSGVNTQYASDLIKNVYNDLSPEMKEFVQDNDLFNPASNNIISDIVREKVNQIPFSQIVKGNAPNADAIIAHEVKLILEDVSDRMSKVTSSTRDARLGKYIGNEISSLQTQKASPTSSVIDLAIDKLNKPVRGAERLYNRGVSRYESSIQPEVQGFIDDLRGAKPLTERLGSALGAIPGMGDRALFYVPEKLVESSPLRVPLDLQILQDTYEEEIRQKERENYITPTR